MGFNREPELGRGVVALKVFVSLVKMIVLITGSYNGFSGPVSAFLSCVQQVDETLDRLLINKQLSGGRMWLWKHICGILPGRFVDYIDGR